MKVKTYKAMDMKEALEMIKKDLGPQAVILSSRKVTEGQGAFGMLGRPMVEVTAALDEEAIHDKGNTGECSALGRKSRAEAPNAALHHSDWAILKESIRELCTELMDMIHQQRSQTQSSHEEFRKNIEEVRWLTRFMAQKWGRVKDAFSSRQFRDLYLQLIKNGVRDTYALEIVERLESHMVSKSSGTRDLQKALFCYLGRLSEVLDPISLSSGKPAIWALIGPTGVGKTTTVAKLAAKWFLDEGKEVALITNDTYRIAAVEQLRTYARILGIPLEVVLQPSDLPRVVEGLKDHDVILMDTTGRSPFDNRHLGELKEYLESDPRICSLLLLQANSDPVSLEKAMHRYLSLGPKGLIGTKLDEANSFGALFNVALQSRLPFAFFTTGQRVPEDIQKASREDIAGWTIWGLPSFYPEEAVLKMIG